MKRIQLIFSVLCLLLLANGVRGSLNDQEDQIGRDSKILSTILQAHNGDPFIYDQAYSQLGDRLINWAQQYKLNNQEKDFEKVKSLYNEDKRDNRINAFRLTWLGLQLSMALTPQEEIDTDFETPITNITKVLLREGLKDAFWLHSLRVLETLESEGKNPFLTTLKICHLFFQPLPVYQRGGTFSVRDYLEATGKGFFLFSLDPLTGKGHTVHGGIYKNALEKTAHDIIHYYQQWFKKPEQSFAIFYKTPKRESYEHYARAWWQMAATVCKVLDDPTILDPSEKTKLEVFTFLIMHEGVFEIPSVFSSIVSRTLVDVGNAATEAWSQEIMPILDKPDDKMEFYRKSYEMDKDFQQHNPGYEFLKIEDIQQDDWNATQANIKVLLQKRDNKQLHKKFAFYLQGLGNYDYWKKFYRDIGHLLIAKGLWRPEDTQPNIPPKLGTTYSMKEMREAIKALQQWYLATINKDGKLYEVFSSTNF